MGDQRDGKLARRVPFLHHQRFEADRAVADRDPQEGCVLDEVAVLRERRPGAK